MRVMSPTLLWHSRTVCTSSDDLWFCKRSSKSIFDLNSNCKEYGVDFGVRSVLAWCRRVVCACKSMQRFLCEI